MKNADKYVIAKIKHYVTLTFKLCELGFVAGGHS